MDASTRPLVFTINKQSLSWSFGLNTNQSGVHNLTDNCRKGIFYASANTGVILDQTAGKQLNLQGHVNVT